MPYKPFEDSNLWQNIARLHLHLAQSLAQWPTDITDPIRHSLLGSALRASQRLAEGHETAYGAEQLPFLQQVRTSLIEIRNGLSLIQAHNPQGNHRKELDSLHEETDQCARMLHGWMENIKNPEKRKSALGAEERGNTTSVSTAANHPNPPRNLDRSRNPGSWSRNAEPPSRS